MTDYTLTLQMLSMYNAERCLTEISNTKHEKAHAQEQTMQFLQNWCCT